MPAEETEDCLKIHIYLLKLHMMWPKNKSKQFLFKDYLFITLMHGWAYVIMGMVFVPLYFSLKDGISGDISSDLTFAIEGIFLTYIFAMYIWKVNDLIPLFEEIKSFDKFSKPKGLIKLIVRQNRDIKLVYVYTIFAIVVNGLLAYLDTDDCVDNAHIMSCGLLMSTWLPFGMVEIPSIRTMVILVQLAAALCSLLSTTLAAYLMVCLMKLVTIRVRHLRTMVKELSKVESEQELKKKLVHCIEYHMYLLRLRNVFISVRHLNAIHYSVSSAIIGLLCFRIVQSPSFKDFVHLSAWMLSVATLCHTGQELINESSKLSTDIYFTKWYEMDFSLRPYVSLMISKTQTPITVPSGIFYFYSHEFLLNILQTSYAYATIAHQIIWKSRSKQI